MDEPVATIRSAESLSELLDEFGWFECGCCLALTPTPGGEPPARVELVLRDFGTGSLEAGELRTYQALRLTATDVYEWSTNDETFSHETDHAMEGVEPVEASVGFGFELDVPTPVRLVAGAFECERLPEVTEAVRPWISNIELFVTAAGAHLPSPADWVRAFASDGVAVAWRIYGGDARSPELVPRDYTGWFVERPSRLSQHDGGVFFRHVSGDQQVVELALQRSPADDELWLSLCRSVAGIFPNGEFRSGNCRFTADEWMARLEAGPG